MCDASTWACVTQVHTWAILYQGRGSFPPTDIVGFLSRGCFAGGACRPDVRLNHVLAAQLLEEELTRFVRSDDVPEPASGEVGPTQFGRRQAALLW